jgi:hypothetical protein
MKPMAFAMLCTYAATLRNAVTSTTRAAFFTAVNCVGFYTVKPMENTAIGIHSRRPVQENLGK